MSSVHPFSGNGPRIDLVRGRQLVSAAGLAALIAGDTADAADGRWRLLEAGCGASQPFAASHIPGAAYLDTSAVEGGPLWNKVPDDALLCVLLAHGIRHDTTVILYGRNNLAAARVAHLLLYAGVADVRLLDGGFAAWQSGGHPCESGPGRPVDPVTDFGASCPAHPEYLVDMVEASTLLARPDAALVSIRSEAEFLGKVSGYSYIAARGDIPGALWGRAGADGDVNSMSAYQHADGTMRPAGEIAAMWQLGGITANRRIAFYCGTGWRASMAFFYAWLMGWDDIAVFDGGWLEWSSDANAWPECAVSRR
ncbi:sulfurtransferase [Pseudoduganella umbonata]|uniref:Thiosulfate/3-mercaptopyruvate sulfurtransferase n=1 Tax=Pseudoduganella umbonata TaxID=864828 RepID=A0A7W5EH79_9BURK|nr:rhodanese-like domain-containing protein [Pseudoduganella umbonata]MBB3224150.1 thiosulfate/3-mercaptopyruvate sulfurtransferase [Pseudoduganella umbonata]